MTGRCAHILLRGAHKGQMCGRKCSASIANYCNAHSGRYSGTQCIVEHVADSHLTLGTTKCVDESTIDATQAENDAAYKVPIEDAQADVQRHTPIDPEFERAFLNNLYALKSLVDPLVAHLTD